jgi:hypothetical protein
MIGIVGVLNTQLWLPCVDLGQKAPSLQDRSVPFRIWSAIWVHWCWFGDVSPIRRWKKGGVLEKGAEVLDWSQKDWIVGTEGDTKLVPLGKEKSPSFVVFIVVG